MGLVEGIKGKRVYLDTNIWIYAVEAYPSHVNLLTQLFTKIDQGELLAVTSELTIAEVLVKRGVPKDQIVIGFHPPELRQYTEYATL